MTDVIVLIYLMCGQTQHITALLPTKVGVYAPTEHGFTTFVKDTKDMNLIEVKVPLEQLTEGHCS